MTTTPDPDDWRNEATAELFDVIISLDDRDQAAAFFRDLCTRRELEEMSRRWRVARLLAAGSSYRRIASDTGVSTATITRINQWLRHGRGGYHEALVRLGLLPEESE
jgi:TrpR-related protein YerC/YecD